jgi:hypothetical protein
LLSVTTHTLYSIVISPSSFWRNNSLFLLHYMKYTHHIYKFHSHCYHFLHSLTLICYFHYNMYVLMNWTHTCGVCTVSTSCNAPPWSYR